MSGRLIGNEDVMYFGSLFAGIEGIGLGLERAGMVCKWQVEIDDYATGVLTKHFQEVQRFGDIRTLDKSKLPYVNLLTGGFPCQPVSAAGKRKGTDDDRWLWPEFRDTIRQVRPEWVLVENVPGLRSIDSGQIIGEIYRDLAELGYDIIWFSLRASDIGAPHRRERVFIVANTLSFGNDRRSQEDEEGKALEIQTERPGADEESRVLADSDMSSPTRHGKNRGSSLRQPETNESNESSSDVPDPDCKPNRHGNDGNGEILGNAEKGWYERSEIQLEEHWAVEPDVGRVADGVPARMDRLRVLGNAVVPQLAEFVGRCILEARRLNESK